ncbi:CUB domain [Popillia japonica]|uniref:CUB domain n=1 Tax=Popillia japonica TaxID=7064 RepID=A0AAW1N1I6_POPJA
MLRSGSRAPEQHLVRIDFRDRFKLENDCDNDFLEVRDGAHGYDELRGTFCGSQFPPIITSSDRHLWLRFKTDENVEYDGFKIVYEFIPRPVNWTTPEKRPCQINMTGEQGFVNNTNIDEEILSFSKQHSLPIDCTWHITVKPGWKIQLTFKKFNLFRPNECENNFLDVFSNKTDIPQTERMRK